MLLVYGLACAAVSTCLFTYLYTLSRAGCLPAWLREGVLIEFLVVAIVGGIAFSIALPLAFLLTLGQASFGTMEGIAAAAAAIAGVAGYFAAHRLAAATAERRRTGGDRPATPRVPPARPLGAGPNGNTDRRAA